MEETGEEKYSIGAKLRDLRLKNGLTQEELADRAELSKGFISQIENDLTQLSVATLIDILTLLGSSPKEFFSEDDAVRYVFTPRDYFEKDWGGEKATWIVPTAQKNAMEPVIVELAPDESTDEDIPHEGEEFGYVLDGAVTVKVGGRETLAKKGDSFYYSSDKRHCIKNAANKASKFIWVSCPPSF